MQKLCSIIAAVVVLWSCTSGQLIAAEERPATQPTALPEMVTFENAQYGYKLQRPKAWTSMGSISGPGSAMFLQLGDEHAKAANTLMISVVHSSDPTKLDDVVDQAVGVLKVQFDGFKIIENKPSKLAGQPSRRLVFTGNATGADVTVRVEMCLVGNDVYSLMLQTVPDRYAALTPTFDAVTDSFQFVEKQLEKKDK